MLLLLILLLRLLSLLKLPLYLLHTRSHVVEFLM